MLLICKLVSHLISHVGIRSKTVYIYLSEYTKNIEYRNAVSAKWRKVRKTVFFHFWLLHMSLLSSLFTITSTLFHTHILACSLTSASWLIHLQPRPCSFTSTSLLDHLHPHSCLFAYIYIVTFIYNRFTSLLVRLHPHACELIYIHTLFHVHSHSCLII